MFFQRGIDPPRLQFWGRWRSLYSLQHYIQESVAALISAKVNASQRLLFGGGGVDGGSVCGCQHGSATEQFALAQEAWLNGSHELGSMMVQKDCSKMVDWSTQLSGGSMHAANASKPPDMVVERVVAESDQWRR